MRTVTNSQVYNPKHSIYEKLLNNLQKGKILSASENRRNSSDLWFLIVLLFIGEMSQGTQIKIIIDLANGMQGLLKPYR